MIYCKLLFQVKISIPVVDYIGKGIPPPDQLLSSPKHSLCRGREYIWCVASQPRETQEEEKEEEETGKEEEAEQNSEQNKEDQKEWWENQKKRARNVTIWFSIWDFLKKLILLKLITFDALDFKFKSDLTRGIWDPQA